MKNIDLVHTIPDDRRCIVVDGQAVLWMLFLLWPIAPLYLACHRGVIDSPVPSKSVGCIFPFV